MLKAGAHRVIINPQPGVELTGWGYYIERQWQSIHDDLFATAVAVEGDQASAIVISVDLMMIDERFTNSVRRQVAAATDVPAEAIMLTATHTHNAPATGGLLGVVFAWLGLRAVEALYRGYERLVSLDITLMLMALGIALGASLLAGLYPTWRVARMAPATYLKTQ